MSKIRMLLILSLLLLFISACGSSPSATSEEETYTLTYNITFPPSEYDYEPKHYAVETFAERIEEETDGRLEIDYYYSNQLAPEDQLLDALASGTVDMGGHGPYWGDLVPTNDALWLPFATQGEEDAMHLMRETEFGDIFEENMEEYGAKVLFYWPTSSQSLMTNEPIRSPEEMGDTNMRLPTGLYLDWFNDLDVAPSNIAATEMYEALQRGMMNGTIYPLYTLDTHNYHEVVDYATSPGIVDPIVCMTTISMESWEQLPNDLQETVLEVGEEMEEKAIEGSQQLTEEALDTAVEHDVEVNELTDEEIEAFQESSTPLYEDFAEINEDTARMVEILEDRMD
ncbi:TRAP transporter substrate-binding protein [Salicibibacter cibarius]|uniref:TRAP transporter substrate-binding protein n=1 Tax=Salicibibacter cibarius TaxID=2743000 RepID=A0A7T6Z438_9BACI|nr:TRAP transporter substrate-binding protein [Salicibibacter cibarius]QQK76433.1 TRAP transporter substrate-binding protein [Salicibibacter cibarius]